MKIRQNQFTPEILYLEGETTVEKQVLKDMWEHGVIAAFASGGNELGICSKKYFGSGQMQNSEDIAEEK